MLAAFVKTVCMSNVDDDKTFLLLLLLLLLLFPVRSFNCLTLRVCVKLFKKTARIKTTDSFAQQTLKSFSFSHLKGNGLCRENEEDKTELEERKRAVKVKYDY